MKRLLTVSVLLAGLYIVVKPEELARVKKWVEVVPGRFREALEAGREAASSKEEEITRKIEHPHSGDAHDLESNV